MFDQSLCQLIIMRDITDLVQGEYLKSVEKLTEVMIASTSHDMRTPLNTIINMLSLIKESIGND
jgi:signal transduction histidine kinase